MSLIIREGLLSGCLRLRFGELIFRWAYLFIYIFFLVGVGGLLSEFYHWVYTAVATVEHCYSELSRETKNCLR